MLFIDVIRLKQINAQHGRSAGDDVLLQVVRDTRFELRVADILFRYGSHEFVAFLQTTDSDTANAVAHKIRQRIREHPVVIPPDTVITIEVTVTCVYAPRDGKSLRDLMLAARARCARRPSREGARVH